MSNLEYITEVRDGRRSIRRLAPCVLLDGIKCMQVTCFGELMVYISGPLIEVTGRACRSKKTRPARHKSIGPGDQVEQLPDRGISHLRPLGITQHAAIHCELLSLAGSGLNLCC